MVPNQGYILIKDPPKNLYRLRMKAKMFEEEKKSLTFQRKHFDIDCIYLLLLFPHKRALGQKMDLSLTLEGVINNACEMTAVVY